MPLLTQTLVGAELQVELACLDDDGARLERRKTFYMVLTGADDAAKATQALSDADDFLADLANVSGADISGHSLRFIWDTGDAVTAVEQVYKELVLTLVPGTLGANDLNHTIFAPLTAILANGKTWNQTANGLAYLDNFEQAGFMRLGNGSYITGGTSQVRNSRSRTVSSGKKYG